MQVQNRLRHFSALCVSMALEMPFEDTVPCRDHAFDRDSPNLLHQCRPLSSHFDRYSLSLSCASSLSFSSFGHETSTSRLALL